MNTARWAVLIGLAAVLATVPAGALGSSSRTLGNSHHFRDSTGEDKNAPDITGINVSNDDAGNISFKIGIRNRPTFTPDMLFLMYLNTDRKAGTGDSAHLGADYVVVVDPGEVGLGKWNGSTYDFTTPQTSLAYGYDTSGVTVRVAARDLGGAKVISFGVIAVSGIVTDASGNPDLTKVHRDVAPNVGDGFYTYDVLTKLTLRQTAFAVDPLPARAGSRLAASLAAAQSNTSGPVTAATVSCEASVRGVTVPSTSSTLANGVATCFWQLPKRAKGKTLVGSITIVAHGISLAKRFAVSVR